MSKSFAAPRFKLTFSIETHLSPSALRVATIIPRSPLPGFFAKFGSFLFSIPLYHNVCDSRIPLPSVYRRHLIIDNVRSTRRHSRRINQQQQQQSPINNNSPTSAVHTLPSRSRCGQIESEKRAAVYPVCGWVHWRGSSRTCNC